MQLNWNVYVKNAQMREFEDIITDFLFHCRVEKNLSIHTLKAYKLDLNQFTDYLSTNGMIVDIEKIDKHLLRNYLEKLLETSKIKTVKRKIATLKALFTYLEFEDRIAVSPFRKMRIKIKEPLQLPGVLTLNEVKALFQSVYRIRKTCKDRTSYTYKSIVRDIVVLELLFATGVRVSELCNLKRVDVNIDQRYIKVNGKGSRERVIQVCSMEIIAILKEYTNLFHLLRSNFSYFFINRLGTRLSEQSVRFMIKQYTRLSNINKEVTPHMFRHTFATLLLEEEVDIRYIQQLLGHSTITTTQIYTHITQQKQKEILSTRHPRGSFKVEDR
jgi:integrase/recombinase XerD